MLHSEANQLRQGPVSILAVGDPDEWLRGGRSLPREDDIAFVGFQDVTAELLAELEPSVVLSPLLANGFDCIDLAENLVAAGFTGRYRAVTQTLPNPHLVVREIRQLCPGLDFDLLDLD